MHCNNINISPLENEH